MVYDLSEGLDRRRFNARVQNLLEKGTIVEMTEQRARTTRQNSYLHLCIGMIAMELGVTLEEAKLTYYKLLVNRDVFVVSVTDSRGQQVFRIRSITELSKEEISQTTDKLITWATAQGWYMPDPSDVMALDMIDRKMKKNKQWL